jgi:hypothetical protein
MGEETVTVFAWNHLNGRRRIPHVVGSNRNIYQLLDTSAPRSGIPAKPDFHIIDMIELISLKPTTLHRAGKVGTKMVG